MGRGAHHGVSHRRHAGSHRGAGATAKLKPLGILPDYAPPEKLLAEIRDEHRRLSEIAKKAGLIR